MSAETNQVVIEAEASDEPAFDPPSELSLDDLLKLVQNQRRRRILLYLASHDEPVSIDEVAKDLAVQEYDCPEEGPTSTQRKRMYVGLYQGHLPKMDDLGVVEFDKEEGQIESGPHGPHAQRFVKRATGNGPDWPLYYLCLAALATGLFAVATLWSATSPAADIVLAVVLGLIGLTAVWQLYHSDVR